MRITQKIIELGSSLGDGRSISDNASITFRDKIPVIATVYNPHYRDVIGSATNCRKENGWIVGDIEVRNGRDVEDYRYYPEFTAESWHVYDVMPPHHTLYQAELIALYVAPAVPREEQ